MSRLFSFSALSQSPLSSLPLSFGRLWIAEDLLYCNLMLSVCCDLCGGESVGGIITNKVLTDFRSL